MNQPPTTRRRSTEAIREASRRSQTLVLALGRDVRTRRRQMQMTQAHLALRVVCDQSRISQIERGHGQGVPLHLWVALGVVLGRPLAVTFSRPLGEPRDPVDAGHLAMQEYLLAYARRSGRRASLELPTRPLDPSRSIDVCVRDDRHRVLILQEAWNTFGDIGAAIRRTNRKVAEAVDLAHGATVDGGAPYRVAMVWVVRASAANRAVLANYPEIVRAAFPASSRRWASAMVTGERPPSQHGLVWLDPAAGRIIERRAAE